MKLRNGLASVINPEAKGEFDLVGSRIPVAPWAEMCVLVEGNDSSYCQCLY